MEYFIAGVGSSAGGLDPLRDFFGQIHKGSNTAFIVVSHLPKDYPTHLHELLSGVTALEVKLLDESVSAEPDHIYVLPGHLRATIKRGVILIRHRGDDEKVNKAIDEFIVSLAEDQKENSIAIILSGMGSDGSIGVQAVHEMGGHVFVQNPNTTRHKQMPQNAILSDNPEKILSPVELGVELNDCLQNRSLIKSNASRVG